ncbi:MAG: hypothetical protein JNL63_08055 [Bacteroidia bacterium]|nr:hypothetical protein [Bacteroidia bacterium]
MKTPSNELFELIRSMNGSEKRFFKLFSSHLSDTNDSKNYIKLFDAIAKQKRHDEKSLKNDFKNDPFLNNFSKSKNYLSDSILKSLEVYHRHENADSIIQSELRRAGILFDKHLFDQAEKHIKKAKQTALEHEKYNYLAAISNWEITLLEKDLNAKKIKAYLDIETNKQANYLNYIENGLEYRRLSLQLNLLNQDRSQKKISQKLSAFRKHKLLISPDKAITFSSLHYYYSINFVCSLLSEEPVSKTYKKQREWIEYLERNKSRLVERKSYYLMALSYMIALWGINKNITKMGYYFNKAIAFFNSLPVKEKDKDSFLKLRSIANNYMSSHLRVCNAQKALTAWEEMKKTSDHTGVKKENDILEQANLFFAHFLLGQYREALQCANTIINTKDTGRIDIQHQARLYALVIHYELGHLDVSPYIVKTIKKDLLKHAKKITKYDACILYYFEKKITMIADKKSEPEIFNLLKTELNLLPKKSLLYPASEKMFDLSDWIQSKIEGRLYADIVKEKANVR